MIKIWIVLLYIRSLMESGYYCINPEYNSEFSDKI